jgi:hypothetical protein
MRAPTSSAVRQWIPPQTRESMVTWSACEKLVKLLVVPELRLKALNSILSVPKKLYSAPTIAPLPVVCPAGYSGKPGVSISGVQSGSGLVAGLPSYAASRIAVIGRHVFQ